MASRERADAGADTDPVRPEQGSHEESYGATRHGAGAGDAGDLQETDPVPGHSESHEEHDTATNWDGPAPGSALDSAIHTLIAAIRQEFARERRREREKLKTVFQQRIRQLEIEANRKVQEKLSRARIRDREKLLEREQRLDDMFARLNELAREVATQKLQLKKSRTEFEQKLMESDFIQSELRHLGKQIGDQIETFGDTLPGDGFVEDMEQERKAG